MEEKTFESIRKVDRFIEMFDMTWNGRTLPEVVNNKGSVGDLRNICN
jgi:hypothetical protein